MDETNAKIGSFLTDGEDVILPEEIAEHIRLRRKAFKRTGFDYLEKRTSA